MKVLVDANNLAAIQFYGLPAFQHHGVQTGAIYGFLRETIRLMDEYSTRIIFAFDSDVSKRKEIWPNYKYRRAMQMPMMNGKDRKHLKEQIHALRTEILPDIGFANVWSAEGYEADDIIAQAIKDRPDSTWLVVSGDKDLWQCLSPNVEVSDIVKKRVMSEEVFKTAWGISPPRWAEVKAIAGCDSDDVAGVRGVGDVKAAAFLRGEVKSHHAIHADIMASKALIANNKLLTTLPYKGTPSFRIKQDRVTKSGWAKVMAKYGITNISVANV
jgi:5'-3' exonuclease